MDLEETMVETGVDNAAADDTLPEGIVEDTDESEEQTLDSIIGEDEGEGQPAEDAQQTEPQATEPGWIKKRVEKAVSRAVEQTRAEMQAMFDAQMAPIREKMLTDEAKELVRQGEFKSLDRAKEYLQLKQGLPVTQPQSSQQPRNAQGQYAPKDDPVATAETQARINMLRHQADRIKADGGPDVIGEFNSNEEIRKKIVAGEMDFYDVAKQMKASPRRKPPSPMRSPNGVNGQISGTIMSMTDKQFEALEKRVREGERFREK